MRTDLSKITLYWEVNGKHLSVEIDYHWGFCEGDALVRCTQEEVRVFGERKTPNLLELIRQAQKDTSGIFDGG